MRITECYEFYHPSDIPSSFYNRQHSIIHLSFCLQILIIPGDVTVEQDVKKVIDSTVTRFGQLDVLVSGTNVHYVFPMQWVL